MNKKPVAFRRIHSGKNWDLVGS